MTEARIIKKYPNRRLYDTEISRYITLEEIRDLVVSNVNFVVIDKKTREDITRSILLQVIAEQEESGNPILRTEALLQIIKFYGDGMQHSVSHYLELSLQLFSDQQMKFKEELKGLVGRNDPIQAIRDMAQLNVPVWKSIRREFFRNLNRSGGRTSSKADKDAD